ncbi:alpha/beta fold hydrolase [Desertibaculum subflavum]|uniref:alpha/beta fold hydrolase n=1 Tax=Desertibaculum subflavum TaxID=2268458 RepID=UPI000E66190F
MLRLLRRHVLALALAACLPSFALGQANDPPVVFVHGNGDTAALWIAQIWRFESNGYARDRLHAIDLRYPSARSVDAKPQEGRTSAAEAMQQLADFVADVKQKTGAAKVALVGNSRGANTIRNYVKNGGGSDHVSHVVLGGGVNRGVIISDTVLVGSEFNGASDFMRQLNDGPDEVVAGVKFMTLRSEKDDKYAQPDGRFIGMAGKPTGISFDAPALKGAENVALAGLDHREVSYAPVAFVHTYRFITGRLPDRVEILPEAAAVLNGNVTGLTGGSFDNVGVAGAKVTIHAVDPRSGKRLGEAMFTKTTGAGGAWGPFTTPTDTYLEFVVEVPSQPITHIYRSPFPRGSNILHLRPARFGKGEEAAGSVVYISRPRGYFGHGRDVFLIDGAVPEGVNKGVPGASTGRIILPEGAARGVPVRFNLESFAVQSWPRAENRIVIAEFHY